MAFNAEARLTIPAQTPERSPVCEIYQLTQRYLTGLSITFPPGCKGAVGIRITDNGSQFAPYPNGWYTGNGETIQWGGARRMEGPPYTLIVYAYNIAIDYAHTITLRTQTAQR